MYSIDEIKNTVIHGHVLNVLKDIPDGSIDLGITSTPYWGLRNYDTEYQMWGGNNECEHVWESGIVKGISGGTKSKKVKVKGKENFQIVSDRHYKTCTMCGAWFGELGGEPTVFQFIKNLQLVFEEFKRVLKPSGSLWVNLGDTYAANRSYQVKGTKQVGGSQPKIKQPQARDSGIISKSLCGVPDRFKISMIDSGWICRNEIIWQKPNQMPNSAKDRFTVDFEKLYWFTKESKYYFEQQLEESLWAERDSRSKNGRTIGGKSSTGRYAVTGSGTYRADKKRNKRTVWSINTVGNKNAHFAVFPESLVETPIIACCPEDGIVMDMFFGSGTTGVVAKKNNRNYVGIELNPEYVKMAEKRLSNV